MNMKSQVISSRERKVTLMVFLMVAAFVGAWSGYGTLCILRLVGLEFSSLSIGISMLIAKTGACLNPVIFIFLNNQVNEITDDKNASKNLHFCLALQFYETVLPNWLKRLTAKTNSVSSPPLGRSSKRSTKSKGQNIQLSNIRTIGNSTTAESQNEPVGEFRIDFKILDLKEKNNFFLASSHFSKISYFVQKYIEIKKVIFLSQILDFLDKNWTFNIVCFYLYASSMLFSGASLVLFTPY